MALLISASIVRGLEEPPAVRPELLEEVELVAGVAERASHPGAVGLRCRFVGDELGDLVELVPAARGTRKSCLNFAL